MTLDVPYYSQKLDVQRDEWKKRACGITALKMVLEYHARRSGATIPSIDDLINEGVAIGGFVKEGWVHDALVSIAHNHGFSGYREEFRSKAVDIVKNVVGMNFYEGELAQKGVEKIIGTLANGTPVIVSVLGRFRGDGEYHMIVLTGFKGRQEAVEGFYYHEPSEDIRKQGTHVFVPMEVFATYWRKMAIFIGG